jgi:hypothetical protein
MVQAEKPTVTSVWTAVSKKSWMNTVDKLIVPTCELRMKML